MILLKSLFRKDQALSFRQSNDPRLYAWLGLFLRECTTTKARRNTLIKHRLAAYSQDVLKSVLADEAIDYDRDDRGILYFYRTQEALDRGVEHKKLLESVGQTIAVLDRSGVLALDPSLASGTGEIAGGVYCPTDETAIPPSSPARSRKKIVARAGRSIPGVIITGDRDFPRRGHQGHHRQRPLRGGRLCARAGLGKPFARAQDRLNLPIYPVKAIR